jgi:hypothetical protein
MKIVNMKDQNGQLMTRIPEADVSYHERNGWTLVENTSSVKKKEVKTKSVKEPTESDLTPNRGEE